MTGRAILGGVLAGVAGAAMVGWAASRRITISRHRVGSELGGPPLRLVQLADLHLRSFDALAGRIAEATLELRPDLLLLTGDSVEHPDGLDALDEFLGRVDAPGVAVIGNWDYAVEIDRDALAEVYERHGIRLLVNETLDLETRLGPVAITGLDDAVEGDPAAWRTSDGPIAAGRRMAIGHEPTLRDRFDPDDPDGPRWMVAGHTHAGQIRLPGWAPVLPEESETYVAGWYRDRRPWLYVSRGLGTSRLPLRLFAPPEIALFEWWPG
ncbi:MAG: hypothetical protein R3326_03680 [Gemmatimonadota bacterium]|nr:hypothetical protein [Gemmatimonadota bacterium]